jgi:S-adenosylmethionine:tRNA ribosyltransferase-isomerase
MAPTSMMADIALPASLEAAEPPEARGLRRDEVRLLVSDVANNSIEHTHFHDLPRWLSPGDLLVVNTSGTLNAAISATTDAGEEFELHLSTQLPGGFWTVEVRRLQAGASLECRDARAGARFSLPAGGHATILAPYPLVASIHSLSRLWMAAVHFAGPMLPYLERYGLPIRYGYVAQPWPSSMYQTVFATEPGSAEMPSAGRPFTTELVTRLVSRGIQIAPLLLHTGVASLEQHEPPYEEFFRVPRATAEQANTTRRLGHRVVAVGTTVVRALETVSDERGTISPGEGWTSLVITPERPVRAVSGLITGLHDPRATHLMLLEQVTAAAARDRPQNSSIDSNFCGRCHLKRAYADARQRGYLWHEFGDAHLILGRTAASAGEGSLE